VFQAGAREAAFAIVGGLIWNIGNILLLTAIVIAGLAVAFPIAAIPAIVLGLGASYWLQPVGNGWVLAVSARFCWSPPRSPPRHIGVSVTSSADTSAVPRPGMS
jgi:hypothetical protein